MNRITIKAVLGIIFGTALLVLASCEKQPDVAGEVLAMVGDRVITKEDFLRRAEYTLRPAYCSGDGYIHRKIVLNSLISEKLLSLETPDSPLRSEADFQAYIQGRQEQSMRQWLFKQQAYDKVEIDSASLIEAYQLANRTYNLQFITLPDSNAAHAWQSAINDGYDFLGVATALTGTDSVPARPMTWFDREDEHIHTALFNNQIRKGDVVGPLPAGEGQYIVMRVNGWTSTPAITDTDMSQQWEDVHTRLVEINADARYLNYVASIMAGKEMHMNKPVFKSYSLKAAEEYLQSAEDKKKLLNQAVWNEEEQIFTAELGDLPGGIPGDAVLFDVDGDSWTVDRFEKYLKKHPLVFRKKNMTYKEFPEQLKFAIADLVRDHFLTQKAYDLEYDKVANIRQATQVWEDHYISRHARNSYLRTAMSAVSDSLNLDEVGILERFMDPLIDSLQAKYSDQIFIDTDLFESLELSNVPMMVSTRNVPFPLAVPGFPRLTTDNKLNYGQKQAMN